MRISDWSSDVCSSDLVPDFCLFKFNVRTQHPSDEGWLQESLDRIVRTLGGDGIVFEIRGGFTRPPKPLNAAQQKDRKSVVKGKSGSVRVDLGGRRILQNKITHT